MEWTLQGEMGVNGGWPAPRPLFPQNGLTMQTMRTEEQPKVRMGEGGVTVLKSGLQTESQSLGGKPKSAFEMAFEKQKMEKNEKKEEEKEEKGIHKGCICCANEEKQVREENQLHDVFIDYSRIDGSQRTIDSRMDMI